MADIVPLHWPDDADRVLDLCLRASDYVALETATAPDAAYVRTTMTDAPPGVPADQVWCWGARRANRMLDGVATCLKGYYLPDDWYLGLLLLDPAIRGRGLGRSLARHVMAQARSGSASCLRIAVLDINPRARVFWERLGFAHEKSVRGPDGHLRHVHRMPMNEELQ